MQKNLKRICSLLLIVILTFGLVSCKKQMILYDDVVTQKVTTSDKTPVTILVKYSFSINSFEKEAEERFPQLDIIQVGNYTSRMGTDEYEARLKNNDLTDIVMTWPLDVGEEYWEDNLIDLSTLPLTGNYTTAMLNNISRDGKLFYLPGPSQVRGIVYNRTLFEEKGWVVPDDLDGFIALCHQIENSGMRSLQLGLGNDEVLNTAFVGYGYESSFGKPENAQNLDDFDNGNSSFADNFTPALDTFQRLIDNGILQKNDLSIYYPDRERMMFSRECAMTEDSVLMARMGFEMNGCTDEFALMPFFNSGTDSDWARLYPVCYIGLNKELAESKDKDKYGLVLQLLEYISTPDGQTALAADTGAMFSSLKGMPPPNIPEIQDLIPALTHGRYAVFPTLQNAQSALQAGLAGMIEGTMTSSDVIKKVDKQNTHPPIKASRLILGSAGEDFSLTETGNFLTDAMRTQSNCDIALFLDNGKDGTYNGKGISGRFYEGDLAPVDIRRVLPDLKHGEKGELWEITMTGEDLINTLEYSIAVDNNHVGWFYYFSGLKMEFAPAAEQGKRIKKITDTSGKEIDPERIYSIAVMDKTVPEEFMRSCEKTGILITTVLEREIRTQKSIAPSGDNRFVQCQP